MSDVRVYALYATAAQCTVQLTVLHFETELYHRYSAVVLTISAPAVPEIHFRFDDRKVNTFDEGFRSCTRYIDGSRKTQSPTGVRSPQTTMTNRAAKQRYDRMLLPLSRSTRVAAETPSGRKLSSVVRTRRHYVCCAGIVVVVGRRLWQRFIL